MTWNIEQLDIKKNSREGEWCQLVNPATGEDLSIEIDGVTVKSRVKMLGPKSEAGIKAKSQAERATREHEAKLKKLSKEGRDFIPTEDEITKSERKDIDYIKAMAVDWDGVPDGKGGAAKFTDKEKERVFAVDGIRIQLIQFSVSALSFIKG